MRSVLVDNNAVGLKCCSYEFPWKYDSNCFNYKVPDEFVMAKDVGEINNPKEIIALTIGCDLEDYSFISEMVNLRQLYIYSGKNIADLEFIKDLINLNHLYISESTIKELSGLVVLIEKQREIAKSIEGVKKFMFGLDAICINSSENMEGNILMEQGSRASEIIVNQKWIKR